MSTVSALPDNKDVFSLKQNSINVVEADDVNLLQNCIAALEDATLFGGVGLNYIYADPSTSSIHDNTSLKTSIEALNNSLGTDKQGLANHKNATTGTQHYAGAIAVNTDPSGIIINGSLQAVIDQLQSEINGIYTFQPLGSTYPSLDARYLVISGGSAPANIAGDLTVQGKFDSIGSATLHDTLEVAGTSIFNSKVDAKKIVEFYEGIELTAIPQIIFSRSNTAFPASYITYADPLTIIEGISCYSITSFSIFLDSPGGSAPSLGSKFNIYDGSGVKKFEIDLSGSVSSKGTLDLQGTATFGTNLGVSINSAGSVIIGPAAEIVNSVNGIACTGSNFILKLATLSGPNPNFVVTKNNQNIVDPSSDNTLLTVDGNSGITTGFHYLKTGLKETGYFAMTGYSAFGGSVQGSGVNFKYDRPMPPGSVALTVTGSANVTLPPGSTVGNDPGDTVPKIRIAASGITKYGCLFEFQTPGTGPFSIKGTYLTS